MFEASTSDSTLNSECMPKNGLIGVIHVSTTTVHFTIYVTPNFSQLLTVSEEIELLKPHNGWFEQDANEIMAMIYKCCSQACAALPVQGYRPEDVLCLGITNQRETTVMWHARTGRPLCAAIVWHDIRTTELVEHLSAKLSTEKLRRLHTLSGLRLSPIFSALKIKWMQENTAAVQAAMRTGNCRAGTLDAWIIWNLTRGSLHVTDVTNASRTLLMNIQTLNWEPALLDIFEIDADILPKICSSSEIYGRVSTTLMPFKDVNICGVIGDQQAVLVGQSCLEPGQTSCTFDSGCFALYNTGSQCVYSTHGLLTTVAYKMGPCASPVYALEGSIAVGGHVFEWLTTKLRILPSCDEAEKYAMAVKSSAGVIFVPAFTGLYAPYWRKEARGTIVGLTAMHNAKHIVRAAHDAICYEMRDILECIRQDCGLRIYKLRASGKLCQNKTLMQLLADISGIPLSVSVRSDRATLGAAYCAAHAYGIDLSAVVLSKLQFSAPHFEEFGPAISNEDRLIGYRKWQRAVQRAMHWAKVRRPSKSYSTWLWSWLFFLLILVAALGVHFLMQHTQIHKEEHTNFMPEIVQTKNRRHWQQPFTF